jgi:hypothetical protein
MTGEIDAETRMRLLINLLVECLQEIPQDYADPARQHPLYHF